MLLGDGYYAYRTSKQTLDILHRRGKSLENQINTLKAVISDLQAEESFFSATATEASVIFLLSPILCLIWIVSFSVYYPVASI